MLTRKDLNESPEYWLDNIQNDIFRLLENYRLERGWTRAQLAKEMGFSKGYISQLLNGGFNHSLLKLIQLSLKVGKIPEVTFKTPAPQTQSIRKVIELNVSVDHQHGWSEHGDPTAIDDAA